MREFTDYAEKAIVRYNLTGYNNLAREIGITKASMSALRAGKTIPADATMIKLAELAGMPKEEALIDLNLWRAKNKPELLKVWQRLSKMISCFILSGVFTLSFTNPCFSKDFSEDIVPQIAPYYILCDKVYILQNKGASSCLSRKNQ